MTILIKATLFDDYKNTSAGEGIATINVELDKSGHPPQTITHNEERYDLHYYHIDKAKYVKTHADPFCIFCALRQSEASTKCEKSPNGEHDFDDIPF